MKKPKPPFKLKKPTLPTGVGRPFKRADKTEKKVDDALSNVPRITNDTVADHREELLKSARKYIYPLQHSKHRVVRISLILFTTVVIGFFVFCGLSLYKFQSTTRFIYAVTQVIPFPVGKAGHRWVSYESYLFELRRNMHYYQTQQQANFKTKDGMVQLSRLKQQALGQVTKDAYVKQLAEKNHVTVSSREVDNQLALVKSQNRLGSNERVFKDVLNEFWGWDTNDFKRELHQQLLQQAVVSKLDTQAHTRATAAKAELKGGADYVATAAKYSDDISTKAIGGAYAATITPNDRDLSPVLAEELAKLKPGEVSDVIDAGYTLEILKVIDRTGTTMHAAHIQFTLQPIGVYTKPIETKTPAHSYIKP